jgi:hypothetical protein
MSSYRITFKAYKLHLVQALKTKASCKRYNFYVCQHKLGEAGETVRRVLSDEDAFHLGGSVSDDNFRAEVIKILTT